MATLWTIFSASRGLQVAVLVLTCWGIWEGNNALQRYRGGVSVIEKTNAEAEKISAEAIENRRRGDVDDAVARLRKHSCYNCDK